MDIHICHQRNTAPVFLNKREGGKLTSTYDYLRYLNRNIPFIAICAFLWTVAFYWISGFSPVTWSYLSVMLVYAGMSYLHHRGRNLLTAILFIVASNVILLLCDDRAGHAPLTGLEFYYFANLLYAFAFYVDKARVAYYITLTSTIAIFLLVNYTSLTPQLIEKINFPLPDAIRLLIFGIITAFFIYRLFVFLYEAVSHFWAGKVEQTESELLFANIDEAICMIDRDYHLKRFNSAFSQLFLDRYKIMPELGMSFSHSQFGSTQGAKDEFFARAFDGEIFKEEYHDEHLDNPVIYEMSLFPIASKDGLVERVGVIYRDISTRRRLEMDIVYSQTGLLEMIAHDLKTPLGMIKSVNSMSPDDGDGHKEFIEKTCEQAIGSINNILTFSRYLSNNYTPGFVNHDLREVLEEKVSEMRPQAALREQRLILEMEATMIHVKMNKEAFGRAVTNLINNSIKFTQGPGEIRIEVTQPHGDREHVTIRVIDQGIGITEDMRKHLFKKFTTAGKGMHGEESFGLGLYISSIIMKLHSGTLELDKPRQKGTSFIIRLPVVRYSGGYSASQSGKGEVDTGQGSGY